MKVDIVYTWCDDSDPNFHSERIERAKNVGFLISEEDTNDRFVEHNELRYSLRSIEKYIPWINHIFLVTNKQIPSWLKLNEKITIVDHSDIIPMEFLPTFNSTVIEQYINKIPKLCEHFILMNDDCFITRKCNENIFFKNSLPIVYFGSPYKHTSNFNLSVWYKNLLLTYKTYLSHYDDKYFPLAYTQHGPDAFSKSLLNEILLKYPESYEKNTYPFRLPNQMIRAFWSWEMAYNYNCPYFQVPTGKLKKLTALFKKQQGFHCNALQENTNINKFFRNLKLFRYNAICINYIYPEREKRILKFLNQKFPKKSQWEK